MSFGTSSVYTKNDRDKVKMRPIREWQMVTLKQNYTYIEFVGWWLISWYSRAYHWTREIGLNTNDTIFKCGLRVVYVFIQSFEPGMLTRLKIEFVHVHALCVKNDFVHIKVVLKTNFPSGCLLLLMKNKFSLYLPKQYWFIEVLVVIV